MTMSCPEVVYQAYYPYLYQRSAPSAHSPAFPPFSHQYDRFNVQRPVEQPSSSLGESSATSAASASAASAGSGYLGLSHHPPSSVGSVSSGGGGVGSPGSPPLSAPSLPRHKEEDSGGPRSAEGAGVAEDEEAEPLHSVDLDSSRDSTADHGHAQYLSANCVVFTHYSGDAAAVVDEHFTRALAYVDSKASLQGKESSPMTARNFPASFWNSNYQSPPNLSGVPGMMAAGVGMAAHHSDLYGDHHPYAPSSSSDPWHYPQYSAAAAHHHRAVHDYHHHHHNMAAPYGGLLLPPARLPAHAHQYGAGGHHAHHPHHAHHGQSMAHHHGLEAGPGGYSYPGMAGLEAQVQETSKDLFWI